MHGKATQLSIEFKYIGNFTEKGGMEQQGSIYKGKSARLLAKVSDGDAAHVF